MKRASTVHELHQSRATPRTCIKRSKSCADLPQLVSPPLVDMGHAGAFHAREENDVPLGEPPLALAPCRWGGEALSFDSRERRASRRHRRNSGTRISVQFLDSPPTVKARSLDEHPRSELALSLSPSRTLCRSTSFEFRAPVFPIAERGGAARFGSSPTSITAPEPSPRRRDDALLAGVTPSTRRRSGSSARTTTRPRARPTWRRRRAAPRARPRRARARAARRAARARRARPTAPRAHRRPTRSPPPAPGLATAVDDSCRDSRSACSRACELKLKAGAAAQARPTRARARPDQLGLRVMRARKGRFCTAARTGRRARAGPRRSHAQISPSDGQVDLRNWAFSAANSGPG